MAVVKAVLLYGSETWAMTPRIGRFLGGFHHRVAHRLTRQQPQREGYGRWVYTTLMKMMEEAGFLEVGDAGLHLQ